MKENQSSTQQNKFLKIEFTSNPVWYALQALPSISVPKDECAHDLCAAYYALSISEYIAKSNPKITAAINKWKDDKGSKVLTSNLLKNNEVKDIQISETPWLVDACSESEQMQKLALLLDTKKIKEEKKDILNRLNKLRGYYGYYNWLSGRGYDDYSTRFIIKNWGRLRKLGVQEISSDDLTKIRETSLYMDELQFKNFENLKNNHPKDWQKQIHLSLYDLEYFYIKTLFPETGVRAEDIPAYKFYFSLIRKQWGGFSIQGKALAVIILQKNGKHQEALKIIKSLRQYATVLKSKGMYWSSNKNGYQWMESAISTQTTLIEAFTEIGCNPSEIDDMCTWLLLQKKTQNWGDPVATVDAIYALLLHKSNWVNKDNHIDIKLGDVKVPTENAETITGYINKTYRSEEITPKMADITINKEGENPAWGCIYWQFSEEPDKIKKSKCNLQIDKKIMLFQMQGNKKVLVPITENTKLKVGDKIYVCFTIQAQQDADYVVLKDQRAACLEPTSQTSGYRRAGELYYYQSPKDASMQFFFKHIRKGTYRLEYPLYVTHSGEYSNGIATLQCLYAPEFVSNTDGVRIKVEK